MINDVKYLKIIETTNESIEEISKKISDEKSGRSIVGVFGFLMFILSIAIVVASIYFYVWFFKNHDPDILEKKPYWGFTIFPGAIIPLGAGFFTLVFGYMFISSLFHIDDGSDKIEKYNKQIEELKKQAISSIDTFSQDFEKEINAATYNYDDDFFNLNEFNYANSGIKYLSDQKIDDYSTKE